MNKGLTKPFNAGGAINSNSFVKFGSDDDSVVQATGATGKITGAVNMVAPPGSAAATGARLDVELSGIVDIKLGGTVTRDDLLTADSNGYGVTAAPAAGVNNYIGGKAMASGVSGDIIPVQLTPGNTLQG